MKRGLSLKGGFTFRGKGKGKGSPAKGVNPLLLYGLALILLAFFYTSSVSPKASEVASLKGELASLEAVDLDEVRLKRARLNGEIASLKEGLSLALTRVAEDPTQYVRNLLYVEARRASLREFLYEGAEPVEAGSPFLVAYGFNFTAQGEFSSIISFMQSVEERGYALRA